MASDAPHPRGSSIRVPPICALALHEPLELARQARALATSSVRVAGRELRGLAPSSVRIASCVRLAGRELGSGQRSAAEARVRNFIRLRVQSQTRKVSVQTCMLTGILCKDFISLFEEFRLDHILF